MSVTCETETLKLTQLDNNRSTHKKTQYLKDLLLHISNARSFQLVYNFFKPIRDHLVVYGNHSKSFFFHFPFSLIMGKWLR